MHTQPKALVTGAAGFIASHTTETLLSKGFSVVGIDNFDPFYAPAIKRANLANIRAHKNASSFDFRELDIRDASAINSLFAEHNFETVFHLAARAGVRPSIEEPALYAQVNVEGTTNLLEAARAHNKPRFILASSSSVYGNNKKVPFSESDDVNAPISPYAATKKSCELTAHAFHHLYDLNVACLRFFTVFGPRQRPDLAINKFMRLIDAGEPIPMFGDGSSSRDYTFIDDIIQGVLAADERIKDHGFRIWNLGGHDPISLSGMIEAIAQTVGKPPAITQLPAQPGDVERTWADLTRSATELDFSPKTSFKEGLRRQWEWMQHRKLPSEHAPA